MFYFVYFILFHCIECADVLYFFVSFCSVSLYFYRIIWPMCNRGLVMPGITTPPLFFLILHTRNLGWVMSGMLSQASVNFTFLALHSLPKLPRSSFWRFYHVNCTNIVHFIHGVNLATEKKIAELTVNCQNTIYTAAIYGSVTPAVTSYLL